MSHLICHPLQDRENQMVYEQSALSPVPSTGHELYFLLKLSTTLIIFLLQKQYMHSSEKLGDKGKIKTDIISPDSGTINVSQCVLCKIKMGSHHAYCFVSVFSIYLYE